MLIKDLTNEKKLSSYLSRKDHIYNDVIICEYNNKNFGILINSGKTNKIVESATELVSQGYGGCKVIDSIEEKIKDIFN